MQQQNKWILLDPIWPSHPLLSRRAAFVAKMNAERTRVPSLELSHSSAKENQEKKKATLAPSSSSSLQTDTIDSNINDRVPIVLWTDSIFPLLHGANNDLLRNCYTVCRKWQWMVERTKAYMVAWPFILTSGGHVVPLQQVGTLVPRWLSQFSGISECIDAKDAKETSGDFASAVPTFSSAATCAVTSAQTPPPLTSDVAFAVTPTTTTATTTTTSSTVLALISPLRLQSYAATSRSVHSALDLSQVLKSPLTQCTNLTALSLYNVAALPAPDCFACWPALRRLELALLKDNNPTEELRMQLNLLLCKDACVAQLAHLRLVMPQPIALDLRAAHQLQTLELDASGHFRSAAKFPLHLPSEPSSSNLRSIKVTHHWSTADCTRTPSVLSFGFGDFDNVSCDASALLPFPEVREFNIAANWTGAQYTNTWIDNVLTAWPKLERIQCRAFNPNWFSKPSSLLVSSGSSLSAAASSAWLYLDRERVVIEVDVPNVVVLLLQRLKDRRLRLHDDRYFRFGFYVSLFAPSSLLDGSGDRYYTLVPDWDKLQQPATARQLKQCPECRITEWPRWFLHWLRMRAITTTTGTTTSTTVAAVPSTATATTPDYTLYADPIRPWISLNSMYARIIRRVVSHRYRSDREFKRTPSTYDQICTALCATLHLGLETAVIESAIVILPDGTSKQWKADDATATDPQWIYVRLNKGKSNSGCAASPSPSPSPSPLLSSATLMSASSSFSEAALSALLVSPLPKLASLDSLPPYYNYSSVFVQNVRHVIQQYIHDADMFKAALRQVVEEEAGISLALYPRDLENLLADLLWQFVLQTLKNVVHDQSTSDRIIARVNNLASEAQRECADTARAAAVNGDPPFNRVYQNIMELRQNVLLRIEHKSRICGMTLASIM